MNLLDQWAIKRTATLNERKVATEKKQRAENEASYALQMQLRRDAKAIIKDEMIKIGSKMLDHKDHVEVGDRVIFNVYELDYKCYNSWDGGPRSVITNVKKEEFHCPIFATVTEIRVSHSFSDDMIDKFLDNFNHNVIKQVMDAGRLFDKYSSWFSIYATNTLSFFKGNLGLYKDVFFTIEGTTFQPRWGLNKGCFLKAESPSGIITAKVWEEEIEIAEKLEAIRGKEKALRLRKEQIDAEYKGITVIR
jgi:hypothetical protein